jgi:4-hydroxy 2-oxovalerate aldolase
MLVRRPRILDCTLRDGGYYTDWHFNEALVCDYLEICDALELDAVEIGYIRLRAGCCGPYGQLPNGLPQRVRERLAQTTTCLAVMLDGKEAILTKPASAADQVLDRLRAIPAPISMVRIAIHYSQVNHVCELAGHLSGSGIRTCINLMQIDTASEQSIADCFAALRDLRELAAVYVADSLGSMYPQRVSALISQFRESLPQPVGFHAHDNQGLALHNSLTAELCGASWIDGTMLGMGRGAGNAKTENLIAVLRDRSVSHDGLHRLLASCFTPLQEKYRWGPSVFYGMAGAAKIHPTYVQNLESTIAIEALSKIEVLRFLTRAAATSYSSDLMDEALRSVA